MSRATHGGERCLPASVLCTHSVGNKGPGGPWNTGKGRTPEEKESGGRDKDGPQGLRLRRALEGNQR